MAQLPGQTTGTGRLVRESGPCPEPVRILHGPFTSALISAPVGMYFSHSALAYLEHACRFKAPVRPGDTLATHWTVVEKLAKPKHRGGIVVMQGVAQNQTGETVIEADGRILVAARPPAT